MTLNHKKAKQEVAFLLNMLSHTIKDITGRASGAVERMAGRAAAKKMPLFFETRDAQTVIQSIKFFLEGGFDISDIVIVGEEKIELTFGRCALREMCEELNIPIGNNICTLFHNYMNGMIMEFTEGEFTMSIRETGDNRCMIEHSARSA